MAAAALFTIAYANGMFLPRFAKFCETEFTYQDTEVSVKGRKIVVKRNGEAMWSLDPAIKVQDALSMDIDRDGEQELIVLCWKIGRYGNRKPFFVEKDEKKWSQHIYIYRLVADKIKPVWMASNISVDACSMQADKNALKIYEKDGTSSRWTWLYWGLSKAQ